MAKPLLRSGRLDDFHMLGENGQTVFELALQIRETLRLRKQQDLFNCLAIPQLNETDNRVNWYAAREGKVIAWSAANDSARRAALDHLDRCYAVLAELIQHSSQAQNITLRLFAAMLRKAFRFPGSQCVYLVAGIPVITFWGFVSFERPFEEEALACLRASLSTMPSDAEEKRVILPDPEPERAQSETAAIEREDEADVVVSLSRQATAAEQPQPAETTLPPSPARPRRGFYYLLSAIVLATGAMTLVYPQLKRVTQHPHRVLSAAKEMQPPAATQPAQLRAPLPHLAPTKEGVMGPRTAPASITAITPPAVSHTTSVTTPVKAALPADALQLPADDLRIGSTRFLNGKWRIQASEHNQQMHDFPEIRLSIADDSGSARFTVANNVSCHADIRFGLMQSGNLIFKSHGKAKCSNDTRLPVPDVVCSRDTDGMTHCNADYGDGMQVALNVRKVKG